MDGYRIYQKENNRYVSLTETLIATTLTPPLLSSLVRVPLAPRMMWTAPLQGLDHIERQDGVKKPDEGARWCRVTSPLHKFENFMNLFAL